MRAILWNKKITNSNIRKFMMKHNELYFIPIKYGTKYYLMTLQNNIYEVLM